MHGASGRATIGLFGATNVSADDYLLRAVRCRGMPPKLLDVVALLEDLSSHNLMRGQVGTIVETVAPDVFDVEFSDDDGPTYHTSLAL
jgi:Domain of unknown function (DUF4926)